MPAVRRLGRGLMLDGAAEALWRVAIVVAPLALVLLAVWWTNSWFRFIAPAFAVVGLLVIVAAPLRGAWLARRSELYLAKWIDLTSGLDDRLTCAVSWSEEAEDEMKRYTVERFALDLNAGRFALRLPSLSGVRRRLPMSLLVVTATLLTIALLTRRPPPVVEANAREKVVVSSTRTQAAQRTLETLKSTAITLQDADLERLTTEMSSLVKDVERSSLDREQLLTRLDQLRKTTARVPGSEALAEAAAQPGAVGALGRSLAAGDVPGAQKSLAQLAQKLQQGDLSAAEHEQLASTLGALSSTAASVDSALSAQLASTAALVSAGDAGAPDALRKLDLAPLSAQLARAATSRRCDEVARSLERAARGSTTAGDPSRPTDLTTTEDGQEAEGAPARAETATPQSTSASGAHVGTESSGAGASAPSEHEAQPQPPPTTAAAAVKVQGVWNGKVIRQVFDGQSGAARPDADVDRLIVEHERVVEERFSGDEVPHEYQDAVRAYFAALHRKERP